MLKLALLLLAVAAGLSVVIATGGDFTTIDLAAAAPYCYHHTTGGGAYNDDTTGKDQDTVESLEGKDFKCGDIISFLMIIEMKDTVVDAIQDLQTKVSFLADPTGQTGVAFGNIAGVSLNPPMEPVENGNGFLNRSIPNPNQPRGKCLKYDLDGGAFSNGNERLILIERKLTKPVFTPSATLETTFRVTNLERNERVIVRIDAFIYCLPDARPTGNLQGDVLWKVSTKDWSSISGGQQTVPLRGLDGILGINCTIDKSVAIVGQDFIADVTTYTPDGGVVLSEMKYSWNLGAYTLNNPGSGTYELHSFETECTYLHDGEYLYAQSECGCESTKIGANQPQLFFNLTGEYYDFALNESMVEPYSGIQVTKYTAMDTTQYIHFIYLTANGTLVRADWNDGRIMIFSNFRFTTLTNADFAKPATPCTCRRRTDIALVLERSADTPAAALFAEQAFATNFTRQFQIDANHNQFAVLYYGDAAAGAAVQLGINAGNDPINVRNAINSIPCAGSGKTGCAAGGDGNVVVALNKAVTELLSSTRSFTGKVVVFVTNGWSNTAGEVQAAVAAAKAQGVEVMVVSYQTIMMAADMEVLTTDPDYLVQRFTVTMLINEDPIDVSSRVCLINQFPCGSACCGFCDTACGQCKPVDSCPVYQGCAVASKLVGLCCQNTTLDTCPDRTATCEVGVCNSQLNACVYTKTCPPAGATDTACYDYVCDPTDGSCTRTPKFTSDQCVTRECRNNAIVVLQNNSRPGACGTSNACINWACDPLVRGCFSTNVPRPGPATTAACRQDVCDPAVGWVVRNVTGCNEQCTLNCGTSDACAARGCNGTDPSNFACFETITQCSSANPCLNATCDPILGGCQFSEKTCDDGLACTIDSCSNVTGQCIYEPVVCTSADLCNPSACNNLTGLCETVQNKCDDGIGCTVDQCEPATGNCIYIPDNSSCPKANPCAPEHCEVGLGCVKETVSCPSTGLFCIYSTCVDFDGCNNQSLSCNNTQSGGGKSPTSCSTVACVEEEKQCVVSKKACTSVVVITAVALTAGIIAGIVVGIIAFIACAGGASYAAFQQMNTGGASAVVNNPLYKSQGTQGTNPLFQQQ